MCRLRLLSICSALWFLADCFQISPCPSVAPGYTCGMILIAVTASCNVISLNYLLTSKQVTKIVLNNTYFLNASYFLNGIKMFSKLCTQICL